MVVPFYCVEKISLCVSAKKLLACGGNDATTRGNPNIA